MDVNVVNAWVLPWRCERAQLRLTVITLVLEQEGLDGESGKLEIISPK